MSFRARIKALEKRIPSTEPDRRLIFCCQDDAGRLTKWADSHPDLPDEGVYHLDMTKVTEQALQAFCEISKGEL